MLFKKIRSRRYQRRILITLSLLITLFLLVASVGFYLITKETTVEVQQTASQKIVSQMNYNINFINEMVSNLQQSIFQDPAVVALRYARLDQDNFPIIQGINRMDTLALATPYMHSILIYSGTSDQFFSGNLSGRGNEDLVIDYFDNILQGGVEQVPARQLIPVQLNSSADGGAISVDFFSYIFLDADYSGNEEKVTSAVILNIEKSWLYNNIETINGIGDPYRGSVYLRDHSGLYFGMDEVKSPGSAPLFADIERHLTESGKETGHYLANGKQGRMSVAYFQSGTTGMTVIHVQPFEQLLSPIRVMRNVMFGFTAMLLVGSLCLAYYFSRKLYRPVQNMMNRLEVSVGEEKTTDEFAHVAKQYQEVLNELQMAKRDTEGKFDLIRNYYLKRLILESDFVDLKELKQDLEQNNLKLSIGQQDYFIVGILQIDKFAEYDRKTRLADKKLYNFAMENISNEIIAAYIPCEIVSIRNDHLVILFNPAEYNTDLELNIASLLGKVQETIHSYYKISLSATFTEPFTDYRKLSRYYGVALHQINYKMVYGDRVIISPGQVDKHREHAEIGIPLDMEQKLTESINLNDSKAMETVLEQIMERMARLEYDYIWPSVLQLFLFIKRTIRGIDPNLLQQLGDKGINGNKEIMQKENLEEVHDMFKDLLRDVSDLRHNRHDQSKSSLLTETIKELIDSNYEDVNLSLQGIADMLNMSPIYVGRIFKKTESVSVADYINEVRMQRTCDLLAETELSVIEIMHKTGYTNQSQFFRVFKKKFGLTPREYRLNSFGS